MTDIRAFKALSLLTTIGVVAVAACTIQLRGGDRSPPPPKAEQTADATSSDLARCRNVTADHAAGYERCKQVWAENRRRFLARKTVAQFQAATIPPPAWRSLQRIKAGSRTDIRTWRPLRRSSHDWYGDH